MALTKISKKDLQKQVARLQRKIDKMGDRLKQQQSELTSSQEQAGRFSQHDELGIELGNLDRRQRELTVVIEKALSRLNELEQPTAQFYQTIRELQVRTHALKQQIAAVAKRGDKSLRRIKVLEQLAETIPPALNQLEGLQSDLQQLHDAARQKDGHNWPLDEELQNRTQAIERQLAELTASQRAQESRTRALSHEIEEDTVRSVTVQALSDRLTVLGEALQRLQSLEPGRRLDQLEEALDEERGLIRAVQQADDEFRLQLGSVTQIAEDLSNRADELAAGSQRLSRLFEDVSADVQSTGQHAQEELRAHERRLQEQQRLIDEAASRHRQISVDLDERLNALEASRQTLQEATNSLGLQQTRQNQDTGELKQALKRRSLGGLAVLLSVAGVLGFLLFREIAGLQANQQALQSEIAVAKEAGVGITGVEKRVVDVEQRYSRMDGAVNELSQQLRQITAFAVPKLSAQTDVLVQDVELLNRENQQRAEAYAGLQNEQQQLKAEVSAVSTAVDDIAAQFAAVSTTVDRMAVAFDERSKPKHVSRPQVGREWTEAQKARHFTLQMAGFHRPESLAPFVEKYRLEGDSVVFQTVHQGRKWYVLFYGRYESVGQALAALRQLPPGLAANKPWVRRIPANGNLYPL